MPQSQTAYNYVAPEVDPRYGVTDNASGIFREAAVDVFAWFSNLKDAEAFALSIYRSNSDERCPSIWDLNLGRECMDWVRRS